MSDRKLKKHLKSNFGQPSKNKYAEDDFGRIKEYLTYRRKLGVDPFLIDETTSRDLDLDTLFKRINLGYSTSGEQMLYYYLHSPSPDEKIFKHRKNLIHLMMNEPDARLNLSLALSKLGRNRYAKVTDNFEATERNPLYLIGYLTLVIGLIASIVNFAMTFSQISVFIMLFFVIINPMIREWRRRPMMQDVAAVNYAVSMIITFSRIKKMRVDKLTPLIEDCEADFVKLKPAIKIGNVSAVSGNEYIEMMLGWFLLDLISYELLKGFIAKHGKELFNIHQKLGEIEAAIAVASLRAGIKNVTDPEIDYSENTSPYIHAEGMVHPLVDQCIPNTMNSNQAMIITGSNASGKSTFLKTVAINHLMSQSICTAFADSFKASAMNLYSSMAISDKLLAGESYYISEIKSIKRILEAIARGERVLCVIDEVLRGTNTIERISASSEILRALNVPSTMSIVATHDLELCQLLKDSYVPYHFQEEVTETEMTFDYKMKEGQALSRNAIKLLHLMGFEADMVKRADATAKQYVESGKWL